MEDVVVEHNPLCTLLAVETLLPPLLSKRMQKFRSQLSGSGYALSVSAQQHVPSIDRSIEDRLDVIVVKGMRSYFRSTKV